MTQMEEFQVVDENGLRFVEANPGHSLMSTEADARCLIEACFYHSVDAVLLHPQNMPPGFFDLSTRQAGEILQRLRNYRLRLVIVCPPEREVLFSSRFREMVEEECQGPHFGVFRTRAEALEWLRRHAQDDEIIPG